MTTISVTALAADHNFASAIEGFGVEPGKSVELTFDGTSTRVRVGSDIVGIHFEDAATVEIERPTRDWDGTLQRATVTHSSSDSRDRGVKAAIRTATVLAFAARVAEQLDKWAFAGELPRLNG
jgi:hypothetical protein